MEIITSIILIFITLINVLLFYFVEKSHDRVIKTEKRIYNLLEKLDEKEVENEKPMD